MDRTPQEVERIGRAIQRLKWASVGRMGFTLMKNKKVAVEELRDWVRDRALFPHMIPLPENLVYKLKQTAAARLITSPLPAGTRSTPSSAGTPADLRGFSTQVLPSHHT